MGLWIIRSQVVLLYNLYKLVHSLLSSKRSDIYRFFLVEQQNAHLTGGYRCVCLLRGFQNLWINSSSSRNPRTRSNFLRNCTNLERKDIPYTQLGGGNSNIFYSHPYLPGGMILNLTFVYFFKWVETFNHQLVKWVGFPSFPSPWTDSSCQVVSWKYSQFGVVDPCCFGWFWPTFW